MPVTRNGVTVRDPWAGGMDSPQFSDINLNNDGIPDLFVFDRVGSRVLTYLGNGGATDTMFTYAPQYESLFPTDLQNWAQIKDYNNDGVPDLFTFTNGGTRVFKGSRQGANLHFDLVSPLLRYGFGNISNNIYTLSADFPVFIDVNGDGDLDVLTYNISGTTISYYENLTKENPGDPAYAFDSLKYHLVVDCWGAINQNINTDSIVTGIDTTFCQYGVIGPNGHGGNQRHAGNSIYAFIDPVYNVVDLLNGNVGYSDLFLLRNCGSREWAHICKWDSLFPTCGRYMDIPTYPGGYGVNVNGDNLEDVLVAPNNAAPFYASGLGNNVKNLLYFKNLGDTVCWYEYQNDSFIVHHMLDFGSGSRGVFYDFNGDGLTDIVTGSYGYYDATAPHNFKSTLAYYQNTGTVTNPAFTEVTVDYDSFSRYGLLAMSPTFGDLDGDGHDDLIVGDAYGYLYFFKNTASSGSSFPAMTAQHYQGLYVGSYAAPLVYDVDSDGLNDLVVGSGNGRVYYFHNFGTSTNPMYSNDSVNANFGNITCPGGAFNYCPEAPFITHDSLGNKVLLCGNLTGKVYEYAINPAKLDSGTFDLISNNFIGQQVGGSATISIADLNHDGKMEYLLGNQAGGLLLFSDSVWDASTNPVAVTETRPENMLSIYPNPADGYFICSLPITLNHPEITVYNLLGAKIELPVQQGGASFKFNSAGLSDGFYLIRIVDNGKVWSGKVMIDK
ncbi:MAG TPA: T9SS type A sorting domain-containing protein [Chitinophagales bacterium]|nr:T9SS type A sorting domain-containing protein [Chitinophagales bacterium]